LIFAISLPLWSAWEAENVPYEGYFTHFLSKINGYLPIFLAYNLPILPPCVNYEGRRPLAHSKELQMQPVTFAIKREPAFQTISGYGKTDLPTASMIASDRISRERDKVLPSESLHDAMDQIFPTGSEVAGTLLGVYAGGELGAHAGAVTGALVGTCLMPFIGTAVGEVAGGVAGALAGALGGGIMGAKLGEVVAGATA
jgi:hypothetical protein